MHCGRVTFITKAYNAGIPEYKIKRIAGHSLKGNVTDGVYNRVSIADLYQAISTIPQYIPDSSENLETSKFSKVLKPITNAASSLVVYTFLMILSDLDNIKELQQNMN